MLKRTWVLIALAYFAFAEALSWVPVPDLSLCLVQPEHSEQSSNHDDKKYCPAFHVGAALALEKADAFLERHDKSVIGAFTIVLAISTIGLWLATIKLWSAGERQLQLAAKTSADQTRDTRESIDLSRREFIASHRPKLILRDALALKNDPLENTIVVQLRITNIGESSAWIVQSLVEIERVSGGYPQFVLAPDSRGNNNLGIIGEIAAGETREQTFVSRDSRWDDNNWRDFYKPGEGVFFLGHVVYLDEPGSGVRRQMGFFRRYDRKTQRFHRLQELNDLEYAD
jgi:hypothetical protein